MITGASDSIECIPSGPAPPTPPPPQTEAFTIAGTLFGALRCGGTTVAAGLTINTAGEEDGTVTGSVVVEIGGSEVALPVTGATTDRNTFSLSGEESRCHPVGPFTVSRNCGTGVTLTYEDKNGAGTFTRDIECTLL